MSFRSANILLVTALWSSVYPALPVRANEAPYQVIAPDAEIRLNFGMLERALQSFLRTQYEGRYNLNKPSCRQPRFFGKLNAIELKTNSEISLSSSLASTNIAGRIFFGGSVRHCSLPAGFILECAARASIEGVHQEIPVFGLCKYLFVVAGVPYFGSDELKVANPIGPIAGMTDEVVIKLKNTDQIAAEFGEFKDGEWVPAERPHEKAVKVYASFFGSAPKKQYSNLNQVKNFESAIWVGQASAGSRFLERLNGVADAARYYGEVPGFDQENTIAQIVIRPGLFSKTAVQGEQSGILNEVLPIRLQGDVKGQHVDIVLTDAKAEFGRFEEENALRVSFNVRSTRSGAYIQNAAASLVLDPPEVRDGRLISRFRTARVQLSTDDFGAELCLDWLIRDNFALEFLDLGSLAKELTIELPDCIDVQDDKVIPERPCKNGQREGFIARGGVMTNARILVHYDRVITSFFDDQTMVLSVPGEIQLY